MANSESGAYWVDKGITCNGCKFLNFYTQRESAATDLFPYP